MMTLKKLYVRCPGCSNTVPSGFQAESPTQLLGFSYICPKCRRIVPCSPPKYLEEVDDQFQIAMKEEEIFALPSGRRIEIMAPDLYVLNKEVTVRPGALMTSDGAIVVFRGK